jgi:hypothetical protein
MYKTCLCRSQRPRGLRRRSSAACLLRLWVRIPPAAGIFVCCECWVLSGRGLCDGLVTRPEESYWLWRVVVCDQGTSKNEEAKVRYRAVKIHPQWAVTPGKQTDYKICHDCKRNGVPLSVHFMYLNIVLRCPEDGYYIAETFRHIVNGKLCHFMICVVFADGIIDQYKSLSPHQTHPGRPRFLCDG